MNSSKPVAVQDIASHLTRLTSQITGCAQDQIDPEGPLSDYGFDSIKLTAFARAIEQKLGWKLEPGVFLQHGTIADLAGHLKDLNIAQPEPWRSGQESQGGVAEDQGFESVLLQRAATVAGAPSLSDDHASGPDESPRNFTVEANPVPVVEERVRRLLTHFLTGELRIPASELDADTFLLDYGVDSVVALKLANTIEEAFGLKLTHRELRDHFTYESLAQYLVARLPNEMAAFTHENGIEHSARMPAMFQLSEGQQGLWMLQKLFPGMPAYNVPMAFRILGTLDHSAFKSACKFLFKQYPILSAVIREKDGVLYHSISGTEDLPLTQQDVAYLSEKEIISVIEDLGKAPFILESGPPFRVHLLTGAEHDYILLVVHHIVCDGLSNTRILHTLWQAYGAYRTARTPSIQEEEANYADFVAWEQKMLANPQAAEHSEYWKQYLGGKLPILSLPLDRARPSSPSFRGDTCTIAMAHEAATGARALSVSQRTNLAALFLATLKVLLFRYTGQEDIIIGLAASSRPQRRFQETIGYFINMVPVRTRIAGADRWSEILTHLQKALIEVLDHTVYPFTRIVGDLKLGKDHSLAPVFQVAFLYQNYLEGRSIHDLKLPQATGATSELLPEIHQQGEYDLALEIFEEKTQFVFNFKFNPDLFDSSTIARFAGHYLKLLQEIIKDPSLPALDYQLISESEQRQLLWDWNDTARDFKSSQLVHELFIEQARRTPAREAVRFQDRSLTYQQLDEHSDQLALHLQQLGAAPDSLVGIFVRRSLEMVVGMLGVLKAGAAYVPLDPDYPAERVRYMAEDSRIKLMVTESRLEGRATELVRVGTPVVVIDRHWPQIKSLTGALSRSVQPEHLAYIIYTSGSTGRPKGAMVEHRSVVNGLLAVREVTGFSEAERMLAVSSYCFDIAALDIFLPLICGGELCLCPEEKLKDAGLLQKELSKLRPTVMQATPATWTMLYQSGWKNEERTKLWCGGEIIGDKLREAFNSTNTEAWNLYGTTESTLYSSGAKIPVSGRITIGKPIANTQIYILDAQQRTVPIGVVGELYIAGDGMARGYANLPELTKEKFIPNPFTPGTKMYKTGDLGRWLSNGEIEFLGRIDFQVKVRGFRIECEEIEAVLLEHPKVARAAVVPKEINGVQLVTYYVTTAPETPLEPAELKAHLRTRLPEFMVPAIYVAIPSLPHTPTGKIDRTELMRREVTVTRTQSAVLPRTAIERKLTSIFEQVLRIKDVGITDNFFETGAHSLLLVEIAHRLRMEFGQEIKITELFAHPTIESLAHFLSLKLGPASPPETQDSHVITTPEQPIGEAVACNLNIGESSYASTAMAIIGIACRLPQAQTLQEYWHNLRDGRECIHFFSEQELQAAGVPEPEYTHPDYVRAKAFIEGIEYFDASFFKYSPREAEIIDPQQRLFLEVGHQALEDAGYVPDRYSGRIGVFAGSGINLYMPYHLARNADYPVDPYQLAIGNAPDHLSTRVAYKLNLRGPALTVQTACSTSLVAVHQAVESLIEGEADIAIAGGVSIVGFDRVGYRKAAILSADGHCRPFDAQASGTVFGQGAGVVVLKPVRQAIQDHDYIYAVILGTAINNDGSLKAGYTAPSVEGQQHVIQTAQERAGVAPDTITYIEAHGTATPLGDPIEIEALTRAFRKKTLKNGFCTIGSVKGNIGHLDSAAGIAGLIKTVLSLQNRKLVPSLNYQTPNPEIDFENSPFYVNTRLQDWHTDPGVPRRAGVSSFGVGGTNAHVIVEEFTAVESTAAFPALHSGPYLLPLSAKSPEQLKLYAEKLLAFVNEHWRDMAAAEGANRSGLNLANLTYTLQVGRQAMEYRAAFSVHDCADLKRKLELYLSGAEVEGCFQGTAISGKSDLTLLGDDEDSRDIVQRWIDKRKWGKLAQLWVNGLDLEWTQLYTESKPFRIPLPTYPFARERYWIPEHRSNPATTARGQAIRSVIHPLLHENTSSIGGQQFTSTFTGHEFFLEDHRVHGERMLPAMAYLEMARAAVASTSGRPVIGFQDVVWRRPITVNGVAHPTVIHLYQEKEAISYAVTSSSSVVNGEPGVCSEGLVLVGENHKTPESIAIQSIRSRCGSLCSAEEIYAAFHQHGIDYGPRFRTIRQVFTNGAEALATFSCPPDVLDSDRLLLHPATMDAALQVLRGLAAGSDGDGTYVPFNVANVRLHGATPATGYIYARFSPGCKPGDRVVKYDIDIADERGDVCVAMRGYTFRLLAAPSQESVPGLVYGAQEWKKLRLDQAQTSRAAIPTSLVVFAAPAPNNAKPLLPELHGHHVIQLPATAGSRPDEFIQKSFQSVLERIQQLIRSKLAEEHLLMVCVPWDAFNYLYAPLAGLLKTTRMENPAIKTRLLYIEEIGNLSAEAFARMIERERSWADGPVEIRYRANGEREGKTLVEVIPEKAVISNGIALRTGGVYWITGGAGELGKIIARHLTQASDATVVLTGRSVLSAEDQEQLRCSVGAGGKVVYLPGDVTRLDDVIRVLNCIRAEYGPVNGIFHAAGVLRDSFLLNKSEQELQAVFAPKIQGLLNIDQATCNDQIDFILLFSSLAAVFGSVGQADYAGANCFLDAYAEHRNALVKQGLRMGRTLSINWPFWQEGGMSVPLAVRKVAQEKLGIQPLLTVSGLAALETALRASDSNLVLFPGDASHIRRAVFTATLPHQALEEKDQIHINTRFPEPSMSAAAVAGDSGGLRLRAVQFLKRQLSVVLKFSPERLKETSPLEDYGIDSLTAIDLTNALEKSFGGLSKTLFFEYQTIGELADYFVQNHRAMLITLLGLEKPEQSAPPQPAKTAVPAPVENFETSFAFPKKSRFRNPSPQRSTDSSGALDIAIIGISGRYPRAGSVSELWKLLRQGEDCITEVPQDRWNHDRFYDPDKSKAGKVYSKWGGFIDDVDKFDPLFFKISPREAEIMDPQERLFLECAWSTLEDAGYTREKIRQMANASGGAGAKVGVYAGCMYMEYQLFGVEEKAKGHIVGLSGTSANIANRVSYYCNLHGPSLTVDTMCSSSLTAISLACQSLRSGESDMALAGGVNVTVHPNKYIILSQGQFISTRGHCESFGLGGDGYIPGEGVGCVLLKPLASAIVDRDHIYGVIKSVAVNHGGKTNGYTVPNPKAQSAVIAEALERGGITAEAISYVEAHGTGTELGDPIEIAGLTQAFSKDTGRKQYCAIGSVKSNIGHLEAAAGIAGVTKVLLQMEHGQVAPSLHAREMNPNIRFEETPFVVQQELGEWKRPVVEKDGVREEYPRIAGISSFGAGGSNAHVIVEEYVEQEAAERGEEGGSGPEVLVPLSARSEERLHAYAEKLLKYLEEKGGEEEEGKGKGKKLRLEDIGYTLQVGREGMEKRVVFLVKEEQELREKLKGFVAGEEGIEGCWRGEVGNEGEGVVGLLGSDEDMREAVSKWVEKRKLGKLGGLWAQGVEVDWEVLYGERRPRRISLPTYPFARERYWVPEPEEANLNSGADQRGLTAFPPDPLAGLTYTSKWILAPPESPSLRQPPAGKRLIIYRAEGYGFESALVCPGQTVSLCLGTQNIQNHDHRWTIDARDFDAFAVALRDIGEIQEVYFLGGLNDSLRKRNTLENSGPDAVLQEVEYSVLAFFRTIKALIQTGYDRKDLSIIVCTQDNCAVLPGQDVNFAAAGVAGLALSLAQEYPRWKIKSVDLTHQDLSDAVRHPHIADQIAAEPAHKYGRRVAFRAGLRYLNEIAPVELIGKNQTSIRRNGVYVILGGAGGLGYAMSEHLVRVYDARLVWIGRRALDDSIQEKIHRLGAKAHAPLYVQADACDLQGLRRALEEIKRHHPVIHGVIHSAVVLNNGTISHLAEDRFRETLALNLQSSVNLARVFADEPLDWFVIFSSVASHFCDLGVSDYTSSCAAKDALAHFLQDKVRCPVHLINWGYWNAGVASKEIVKKRIAEQHGTEPISASEGARILERTLAAGIHQVLAFRLPEDARLQLGFSRAAAETLEESTPLPVIPAAIDEAIAASGYDGFKPIDNDAVSSSPAKKFDHEEVVEYLKHLFSKTFRIAPQRLEAAAPLEKYGIDSVIILELTNKLQSTFANITRTLFFECQTIDQIAAYLLQNHREQLAAMLTPHPAQTLIARQPSPVATTQVLAHRANVQRPAASVAASVPAASAESFALQAQTALQPKALQPIAVIGLSARYAQARDARQFWRNLKNGADCVSEIPGDRWKWEDYYCPQRKEARRLGKSYSKWGAFVDGFSEFDPLFFNISPREAINMDPQERLFLQSVWELMEDAGYTRKRLEKFRVGVFAGITKTGFSLYGTIPGKLDSFYPDTSFSSLANRVSYFFNFQGPSMPIDTMCSSSLTAIHEACEHLRRGECDMALAGGVNLYLHPANFVALSQAQMLSQDNHTRSFGKGGNGFVPGEGVGCVLLKPLDQAIADRDHIYGVLLSSSVNHGGKTNGYTVPNPHAQSELVRTSIEKANITAEAISYVEAHGTGTELGDPIEIAGLTQAFSKDTGRKQYCAIGSVKSNIGHLEAAAGIAGVTKVLLQMEHGQVAPSLHAREMNPNIRFEETPFVVQQELGEWKRPVVEKDGVREEYRRIAGISSFGAGGSNAHVIVEEYVEQEAERGEEGGSGPEVLVPLSARSEERLHAYAEKLLKYLEEKGGEEEEGKEKKLRLEDIGYTLQVGREGMEKRVVFLVKEEQELREKLKGFVAGEEGIEGCWRGEVGIEGEGVVGLLGSDEDMREAVSKWVEKRKLGKLGGLWAQGVEVDWEVLYGERRPRRISLPTYPFARERYWIPEAEKTPEPKALQGKLHALVHENTSHFTQQQFASRFQGNEFFFRDHWMHEAPVLPGVAYLEMARVAGELSANQTICQIKNVGWIKPINAGNTPQEVVICLVRERNQIAFKVFTGDARSTAHAEGFLVTGPGLAPKRIDLEDIERRCNRRILGKDECYRIFENHGAHYGPSFQALKTISIGENELLARLALPPDLEQSAGDFLLHPSLLDGALQASIGLGLHAGQSSTTMGLPFALDELTIHRKLSHSMVAYVRYSHGSGPTENVPEVDIDLCDDGGEICIAFHKLAFRSVPSSISKPVVHEVSDAVDSSAVLILQPVWKPAEITPKTAPVHYSARVVILVEFDKALKTAVDQHLAQPSILLESSQPGIEVRYGGYAKSIFTRLKEILLEKPKEKVLVQVVVPLEDINHVYSGLGALLSTVKQENPKIVGQVLAMSKADSAQLLIDRLEQNTGQFDLFVRYSNGICEQRNWEQAYRVLDQPSAWNATDCVLITGGAGRLGRLIAMHLASGAPGIRLFLSGRSAPGPHTDRVVQELTQLGASATYLQADISHRTDVENLVRAILNEKRPLTGIVHAAGVVHDNFIIKKNLDELEQVLAPKVAGLVYLDECTSDHNLKHFIVFASSAGALGNIGQADYAAANAFMDAYCHYRNTLVAMGKRHGKSTAIDWPLWQDGGMKVPESLQKMIEQKFGLKALSTPSGLKAFDQCLQYASSQLLVLTGIRHKIADSLGIRIASEMPAASTPLPILDEEQTSVVEVTPSTSVAHPRDTSFSQPAVPLRDRTSAFIKEACSGALKIPVTQLQNHKSFSSYGIDSLMVADITNELEKGLGALPKTLFFQYQNIDELTNYLLGNHREQLEELLREKVLVSSLDDGAVKQSPASHREPHRGASTDKKPEEKTKTVARHPDRMPAPPPASQPGQYGELVLKSELSSSHKALLESIAGEAFLGSYLFDLWHWFYISRDKDAFIHAFLDEDKTLFVTCYQGVAGGERELLRELSDFAQSQHYQICYWSFFPPDPALEQNGWVSCPIGAVQVIHNLADFDLSGTRNRKLRYVVNRFGQAGQCETRECTVLTNEVRQQIVDVVSSWCEHKKFVHSVKPFIAELKDGTWRRRYRMFLTRLDGVLQNILLITGHAHDGYLMDQEYYDPEMPMGGIEYAVVEIINCLKNEGCRYFSLGMTWGIIDNSQGSDQEGHALLAEMKQKETFLSKIFEQGEKNYRFKNKFQPVNDVSCFYRSAGTQPEVIIRFLSMFMEKGVPFAEIQKLLNELSLPAAVAPEKIEQPEFPGTQDEDRFFDVTKIAADDVRIDMISDSWVYLRNKSVTSRIQELIGRIDPACDYEAVIREVLGCPHIHLAPLGRTAEKLFFQSVSGSKGKIVANLLFETAIHNLVSNGFHLLEAPDRRVFELNHSALFRGGIDPEGLQDVLDRNKGSVKMIFLELGDNASGGHPVSMAQLRQTASLAAQHNLMLVLDISRVVKNAIFVREYEPGYQDVEIWSIVREIVSHADCIVGSLSKEFGINMGGIVGSKHHDIIAGVRQHARMEGGYINEIERGIVGEAFRELAYIETSCIAQIESTKTIRRAMEQAGIPCVGPAASHCIVVPARRISGYDSRKYASESFLQWFWEKTGIRGGVHLAGNQKGSSLNDCARFCVPMGFTKDQEQWAVQQIGELSHDLPQKPLVHARQAASIAARQDKRASGTDIAIVGMSGRFPGARDIHEFWANLKKGIISIGEIPKHRWDWQEVFENPGDPRTAAVRWGAFMADVDKFDAGFFDISPREAKLMDPQQRLMLLCAWEAIEDAGYTRKFLRQSKTGVFIASASTGSAHNGNMHEYDRVIGLGSVGSIAANRISYHFDLSGPSETYDTSCSSSFVALHRAIQSIYLGDCGQAIVGGVQVLGDTAGYKDIASIGFLSRAGRVRSFDEQADGYVRSESVAAVLIKPLGNAIAAGDHIYAVIKGTGLCHGGSALSITTPSVNGMKEAMLQAYRQAGVDPRSVQYIEAHGIGSPMGDALEIEALKTAYAQLVAESKDNLPATTCHIGSLKPNLGHPEVASGMCVLIKAVMALQERVLPGILGFERLNSQIAMKGSPFVISAASQPWNSITDEQGRLLPRRASVNSYGVGGVNTHVLLEEYLATEMIGEEDLPQPGHKSLVFTFSARQQESLDNYVKKFIQYLQSACPGSVELESIAYTLQIGRESLEERLAVLASSKEELINSLQFYVAHSSDVHALAQHRIFAGHSRHASVNGNGAAPAMDQQEHIAAAWAGGTEIAWQDFHAGRRLKRVSLPTYAFVQQQYAMPAPAVIRTQPAALKLESNGHQRNGAYPGASLETPNGAAPRNEMEHRMAEIWSEVLGVDRISIHDDFFELGGHSVLALQLANRLAAASFDCSVRELYQHPTIFKLSQRVRSQSPSSNLPARSFPLLPVQAMLVSRKPANDSSSRDAMPSFLEIHHDVNEQVLVQALQDWYAQDIFRLRFQNPLGEWRQYYSQETCALPIRWHDAGQSTDVREARRALLQLAQEMENDLNILSGPLIQIGLVKSGGRLKYMVWVTDHLVTDNFSFFTLLTNLKLCYQYALQNRSFQFSRDTIIAEWAERLLQMAHEEPVIREFEFWRSLFPTIDQPQGLPTSRKDGAPRPVQSLTAVLNEAETASCFSWISANKLTLEELCLVSLLMGYQKCSHASNVLLRMAANGREGDIEGLDLTRGLGWFSVVYPALFSLDLGDAQASFFDTVIRQHRAYLDKREHYGLLRYINHYFGPQLQAAEDWSQCIAFNCFGDIDPQSAADDLFCVASEGFTALLEFTEQRQDYDRGFWFFVLEGRLHIRVLFRPGAFSPEEMEDLLQETKGSFLELCRTMELATRLAAARG